jgi:hypothetical protein
MKFGDLLEFRKDLYFEGAVQIDWFYDPVRAAKVAENFVFHGKDYFGVEELSSGGRKRIDTVSLVQALTAKLNDESVKVPSLAIADYGTGKSHLAVTLGQLFSGPDYMPETYNKVLENIRTIDESAANEIANNCDGRNFVMVINGMRDFNLHSEILRAAQKSLALYGLPDDNLRKLNRALETAEMFFDRNSKTSIAVFEKAASEIGWSEKGEKLERRIKEELISNDEAFEIVNYAYREINGQEIRWDEGLSASAILEMLVTEYCGMNGKFDHVVLLFDEFGRYLEYASGVNAAKSGDSALQQIFETVQNADGALHVINFIQSDIKTYLQRVDQTKNISRYIGRYDGSDKYYISSNLETVFANLIQRKDKEAFNNVVVKWQSDNEETWKRYFDNINKWLITKGMWKDYKLFRKVVVEGIYPMHPLATFMLTQLSDYLQNRSSLTLISQYIEGLRDTDIDNKPIVILPEQLMTGDLYVEMLAAEQDGKQPSQQCILYSNILGKFGDKLSEKSLVVLRSNLILRILRFRTADYDDAKQALAFASGLSLPEIEAELQWLENEYAVLGFDDHAGCFDFMEESNGAHDFKVVKKRLIAAAKVNNAYITNLKIQEIAGVLDMQATNFGTTHKIATNEWQFKQELYPIEEFTEAKADSYISEWRAATSSIAAKGRLVWLYVNKDSDSEAVNRAKTLSAKFEGMPIVIMLINDDENRLFNCLIEYYVFDNMDDLNCRKYERHYLDGFKQAESNLKDEFEELKKMRLRVLPSGVESVSTRMASFLTNVFDEIYPNAVPFWFDSFVTKGNNLGGKGGTYFCSIIKMLLSGSVNSDSIHNFASDVRNRIDAVLMTSSSTSWKCINDQYRVIPPENKWAKLVYDAIVKELTEKEAKDCEEIFSTYSQPPYGMSEDIITLMISVICANLSYCLRFKYKGEVKNINVWKDLVVIKDKKIDIDVIRKSTFIVVDAGEVVGKYKRLFTRIQDNRIMSEVNSLARELEQMTMSDEVPEEIQTEYLLAKNLLDKGIAARKEWQENIGIIEDQYDEAIENNNLYNALKALEGLNALPINKFFGDNGFDFDDESKKNLKTLDSNLRSFVDSIIDEYISSMYCKDVEHLTSFRNHQTRVQKLLEDLGFAEYARRVERQKENELDNINEIRSRQELRADIEKFLSDSKLDRSTTHVAVKDLIKRGNDLQTRIAKYKATLGKEGGSIQTSMDSRLQELENAKNRVEQDITDIWDDLTEVNCPEDIEDLIERIGIVLQKGIAPNDQGALEEVRDNLKELLADVESLFATETSRAEFVSVSEAMKEKYAESEFDFEVNSIIDEAVSTVSAKLDEKESTWVEDNLSLGDKSRGAVHKWKEKTRFLPEYLSEKTKTAIKKIDKEADEIIKEGKIEDVVFYFDKLSPDEKAECIEKLKALL